MRRNETGEIVTRGIGQIAAHHAGVIGQPVGESRRFRIQQQARRFAGAGGYYRGPAANLLFRARGFIHIRNRRHLAGIVSDQFASHRPGNDV